MDRRVLQFALALGSSLLTASPSFSALRGPAPSLGERLFMDSRFSQSRTFACVTCHLSPDLQGMGRGFSDFNVRSPVPTRTEESPRQSVTLRNTTALIDLFWGESPTRPNLLHSDGEFETPEALVIAGLIGRNMGWLPHEKALALDRIAEVAQTYSQTDKELQGLSPRLAQAVVADAISAYMRTLQFSRDASGRFDGSPYDQFLLQNALPTEPDPGESSKDYGTRLLHRIEALEKASALQPGPMGQAALTGLKIFYATPTNSPQKRLNKRSVGNCAGCHSPPIFSDFGFHNTGASQEEYDLVHGMGSFAKFSLPSIPAQAATPDPQDPTAVDLGAWHQLKLTPDQPLFVRMLESFCERFPLLGSVCNLAHSQQWRREVADSAIAAFKTPTLRGLALSDPYFHTGLRSSLEKAVQLYVVMGIFSRDGRLRNPAPEMQQIFMDGRDIAPLAAFLRSLNDTAQNL